MRIWPGIWFALVLALPAAAHFLSDPLSREVHVAEGRGGEARVLIRQPLTFAYAAELAARAEPEGLVAAPYLSVERLGGRPYYRFDRPAFEADPEGFATLLLRDKSFAAETPLRPEITALRLVRLVPGTPPPSGIEALSALLAAPQDDGVFADAYVSDLSVVLELALPALAPGDGFTLTIAGADFALPPETHFSTLVADHRAGGLVSREYGDFWPPALAFPAHAVRGPFAAATTGARKMLSTPSLWLLAAALALAAPRPLWLAGGVAIYGLASAGWFAFAPVYRLAGLPLFGDLGVIAAAMLLAILALGPSAPRRSALLVVATLSGALLAAATLASGAAAPRPAAQAGLALTLALAAFALFAALRPVRARAVPIPPHSRETEGT